MIALAFNDNTGKLINCSNGVVYNTDSVFDIYTGGTFAVSTGSNIHLQGNIMIFSTGDANWVIF